MPARAALLGLTLGLLGLSALVLGRQQGDTPTARCTVRYVQPDPARLSADLANARARWTRNGPGDYRYDITWTGEGWSGPHTVHVRNGKAAPLTTGPGNAGPGSVPDPEPIDPLFDRIETMIGQLNGSPCGTLTARYDPWGVPVELESAQEEEGLMDAFGGWRIENVQPGGSNRD